MSAKQFDQLLEKVHDEIQNAKHVDKKGRELLQDLEQDIRALLDQTEKDSSASRRLRDAIRHFEVTHPALTAALSEVSTILSNAGI